MGRKSRRSLSPASQRRQWDRIFRALVEMLRSHQSQIESLADDRRLLENYVGSQHDRWAARCCFLESQIAQMKNEEEKRRRMESAWQDLTIGLKKSEAVFYKKQLELTESDLEEFREYFEALSAQVSELKEKLDERKGKEVEKGRREDGCEKSVEKTAEGVLCTGALESEMKSLKHAYKKLSSKREAGITALLAEKDFVCNQFKNMENDYIGILKTKKREVDQANEAVEKLQSNIEKMQSLITEKDFIITMSRAERTKLELDLRLHSKEAKLAKEKTQELLCRVQELDTSAKEKDKVIVKLRKDMVQLEIDLKKCRTENARLSANLELKRSSRNAPVTPPPGSHLRLAAGKRKRGGAGSQAKQNDRNAYYASPDWRASGVSNQLQRCTNSEKTRSITTLMSPKLFSANFKVPKLKISSPAVVS